MVVCVNSETPARGHSAGIAASIGHASDSPLPWIVWSVRDIYRLDRYGAGRCVEFATSTPEMIADAMLACGA